MVTMISNDSYKYFILSPVPRGHHMKLYKKDSRLQLRATFLHKEPLICAGNSGLGIYSVNF